MTLRPTALLVLVAMLPHCVGGTVRRPASDDTGELADTDAGDTGGDTDDDCPLGQICNPIPIASFPYFDQHDTTIFPDSAIDVYACDPEADESGPELFFEVFVPEAGVLAARVEDPAPDVDIDLHLMGDLDPHSCITREHETLGWYVEAGTYVLVADSWVDGGGDVMAGPFGLAVEFAPLDTGPCAVVPRDLRMHWTGCAAGIDCYEAPDGDGVDRIWLTTPAFGPVVQEAHLVTPADNAELAGGWPTTSWEGIPAHYARSVAVTGYEAARDQPWAPDSEGNLYYGQGATGQPVPVEDETWYVNMYWRDRPAKGTRMLVLDPFTGRAVVASGGYESGPGSNTAIGGATEEIHHWLGTNHRDLLVMAFLVDQSLPLGPVDCTP